MKNFELSFCTSNLKNWSTKQYEVEGPSKHNPNQFMASQNVLYNYFKSFFSVIFRLRSNVFEANFQEPLTLRKVNIAMGTLAQHLN